MIRKKVRVFFILCLGSLLLLPLYNVWHNHSFKGLYNQDVFQKIVARPLYNLGISLTPRHIILGKEGWFFLGDYYVDSFSKKREVFLNDEWAMDTVMANSYLWEQWFKEQGVELYRIMLAPDKDTVYTEYLPDWAAPRDPSPMDYYTEKSVGSPYVIVYPALMAAKAEQALPLYYRTDSHWNRVGAWYAFKYFAEQVGPSAPQLRWPDAATVEASIYQDPEHTMHGDLPPFQRLGEEEHSPLFRFGYLDDKPTAITKTDLETGELLYEGIDQFVHVNKGVEQAIVNTNPQALNQARVLWITDSYGYNLVPWMRETFSEVLRIHVAGASPERVEAITTAFKPQYVFTTTVERESRYHLYLTEPP